MAELGLDLIQERHQTLLHQIDETDELDVSEITVFLGQIAQTGSVVGPPEQRSHLRALIRYWGSFVNDKTGQFPVVELHPFDGSEISNDKQSINREVLVSDLQKSKEKKQPLISQVGPYEILEEIGQGGFSTVYVGRDSRNDETIAIKVFTRDQLKDTRFHNMLLENEKIVQFLEHPNILRIHDVGVIDGITYTVMDYVSTGSLAERMSQWYWRPKLGEIINIVIQVADGLHYLHKQKIIHRDIKPGNILLDRDNQAYITDFGIAQIIERVYSGVIVGTPAYMAPETIRYPNRIDGKTDIYSLGIIMYELISGKPLFSKEIPPSQIITDQIQYTPPRLDSTINVPHSVSEVVEECLKKNPDNRPTALELKLMLELLVGDKLSEEELNSRFGEYTSSPEERPSISLATTTAIDFSSSDNISKTSELRCPQCGMRVYSGAAYCDNCGAALSVPLVPQPAPTAGFAPPPQVVATSTLILPSNKEAGEVLELPIGVLIIKSENKRGSMLAIKEPRCVIGRSTLCNITLNDRTVSDQHSMLIYQASGEDKSFSFVLWDLASSNGTFVNGERVTHINLKHNDVVKMGVTEMIFKRLDD